MQLYMYRARTTEGKRMKGKLKSSSKQEAITELEQLNLYVYEIKKLNSILHSEIHIGKQIKNKEFVIFLRQFATLIDAGISLVDSVGILIEQSNSKALVEGLKEVKEDLQKGISLSEALAHHPKLFPDLLISMIHAGEVSGRIDEILERMANYYEKQHQLMKKIETALTYPIVISLFAMIISIFLITIIVPIFTEMFISFDQDIPLYTQAVLNISGFFQTFWWLLIGLIIMIGFIYKALLKQSYFAYQVDKIKLKLPIFGPFMQKAVLARMTQTLSSLLNSSVPIIQATTITERVISNRVIKNVLKESRTALEEGKSLAEPMRKHWVFPKLITQMITVGEATGALDQMLSKVAGFYEQEIEEASDKLKSLIEPVMIIILSIVIGAIILAIVIPMFSIFENI